MKILSHVPHGPRSYKRNYSSTYRFVAKHTSKCLFSFRIDYIRASELLDRLPTVEPSDLADVVEYVSREPNRTELICLSLSLCLCRSLASHLDNLDTEYFNELLIRRLFVPFMFLCPSTRAKIIPRILIPKETDANAQSWISTEAYRTYVIPLIVDLFAYHVTCIRETLLEYYNSYWQLIDRTTLINVILPQVRPRETSMGKHRLPSFAARVRTERPEQFHMYIDATGVGSDGAHPRCGYRRWRAAKTDLHR